MTCLRRLWLHSRSDTSQDEGWLIILHPLVSIELGLQRIVISHRTKRWEAVRTCTTIGREVQTSSWQRLKTSVRFKFQDLLKCVFLFVAVRTILRESANVGQDTIFAKSNPTRHIQPGKVYHGHHFPAVLLSTHTWPQATQMYSANCHCSAAFQGSSAACGCSKHASNTARPDSLMILSIKDNLDCRAFRVMASDLKKNWKVFNLKQNKKSQRVHLAMLKSTFRAIDQAMIKKRSKLLEKDLPVTLAPQGCRLATEFNHALESGRNGSAIFQWLNLVTSYMSNKKLLWQSHVRHPRNGKKKHTHSHAFQPFGWQLQSQSWTLQVPKMQGTI